MNKIAQILLVEDNPMDVILTLDAFKEARLKNKISVTKNGQEALDFLFGQEKYADRTLYPMPNLILLDQKMPGVDGFIDEVKKIDDYWFTLHIGAPAG
jgi:two-component system, response regulator